MVGHWLVFISYRTNDGGTLPGFHMIPYYHAFHIHHKEINFELILARSKPHLEKLNAVEESQGLRSYSDGEALLALLQ